MMSAQPEIAWIGEHADYFRRSLALRISQTR
jgi:hypothetical protein